MTVNQTAPHPLHVSLCPGLDALRSGSDSGEITTETPFAEGVILRADPALRIGGTWRSPAGRMLELEATPAAPGGWLGLHVTLGPLDLARVGCIGFTCRSCAPEQAMIRAALRSGTDEGFVDSFFPAHILATPEVETQVDVLEPGFAGDIPDRAPWRELVLFLPKGGVTWHLHDLRLFLA